MIKNLSIKLYLSLSSLGSLSAYAQCTPVSSFTENFDSYSSPSSIVPTCWDRIALGSGSQIISGTSPASGTKNIYQSGYGSGNISIVILPQLSNVNAGTHHFKFKVRVNSGPGQLDWGYMTDPTNAATFVTLQTIYISNSTYDASSERILTVPTSVPANARLAISNSGATFAGHYWDDAVWESISGLGTEETSVIRTELYPNPFHDFITISEVKDAEVLTINDISGRLIRTIEHPSSKINLNDLKSGVYFATLQWKGGKQKTFKIIKQ